MPHRAASPRTDRAGQPWRPAALAHRTLSGNSTGFDAALRNQSRFAEYCAVRAVGCPCFEPQSDGGDSTVKLVIFGLTISSSWGNGHATLWRGLCKALARRGHRVVFFERDVSYY